ncbi:MAG: hypothetical protein AAFN70_21785, partial [Planctomycetota bacterium]
LKEANVSHQHSGDQRYGSSMRRDRYGNYYYPESTSTADQGQVMALRRINPVKVQAVLDAAPTGKWFDAIPPHLRPQYTATLCRLWLKVNEAEKAFPYIEQLAAADPDTAKDMAEEFLKVWTTDHNPNEESERTNRYMFMFGYDNKADKIPLTRSKQERNLKELSGWVQRIQQLPLDDQLDEQLLVRAFMTCHSTAEVYDLADIEKVFGAWDNLQAETMAQLIDTMRGNLGGVWRDPNVQRNSKTKRKKPDIQAEVVRGYAVAKRVLDRALVQHPEHWRLLLSKACIMHDENDFVQSIQPGSSFSANRLAAFEQFQRAAAAYVNVAPDLPEKET